jgi:dienelactone hydrolase
MLHSIVLGLPTLGLESPPVPFDVAKQAAKRIVEEADVAPISLRTNTSYNTIDTTYDINAASGGIFSETAGMIKGEYPATGGPFPLFVWSPGTGGLPSDNVPGIMVREMASRGYAAVAVQYGDYTNIDNKFEAKASAIAGSSSSSALSVLCALDYIDCSKGIASAGYSQGTHIAALLAKYSNKVTAAYMIEGARPTISGTYTICDAVNLNSHLPASKRRYMTGEVRLRPRQQSHSAHLAVCRRAQSRGVRRACCTRCARCARCTRRPALRSRLTRAPLAVGVAGR